jgi:transposase
VPLLSAAAQLSHPETYALIAALTARLAFADARNAAQSSHIAGQAARIVAQDARIASQDARIAALEARLNELTRPPKTPGNSSKPPSQGQKQDLPAAADRPPRKSRPGVGRTLHPNPDRTIDRLLSTCPKCEAVFPDTSQTPQQVYERIELPPVRPDVTQIRLFGGRCACCGERVTAKAPPGLEPGSPFGPSIAAMVVYLHYAHAIGMEWLALLMNELFALSISEGAISNILARAREPLRDATAGCHGGDRERRARQPRDLLGRDLGAGQRQELVGVGVHRHAGGAACDPTQPRQGGGDRAVRRHPAGGVGL